MNAADLLPGLLAVGVDPPVELGSLQLFPLSSTKPSRVGDYLTGPAAETAGVLEVRERSGSATVGEVFALNRGQLPVLLIEGEMLLGMMQNRVVNSSTIVPRDSEVALAVSCVERGRWHRRGGFSGRSGHHAPPSLRQFKSRSVSESLLTNGTPRSDQAGVWAEVDRFLVRSPRRSATSALEDAFEETDATGSPSGAVSALEPRPNQIGVAVARGGALRVVEIFDRAESLAAYWPALLSACLLEQEEEPGAARLEPEDVRNFISQISDASPVAVPTAGLGEMVTLGAIGLHGQCLTLDRELLHLVAFPDPPEHGGRSHLAATIIGSGRTARRSRA